MSVIVEDKKSNLIAAETAELNLYLSQKRISWKLRTTIITASLACQLLAEIVNNGVDKQEVEKYLEKRVAFLQGLFRRMKK